MNDLEQVLLISFSACAIIILYGKIRCTAKFVDPLTMTLSDNQKNFTDGWAISHFLFFFVLTSLYPSQFPILQLGGILWEMAEFLNETHPFYLTECNSDPKGGTWWYGRKEDLLMNLLGGLAGLALAGIK